MATRRELKEAIGQRYRAAGAGSAARSWGNVYRLVVAVDFEKSIVWIKWIGTHKDYDRIDVTEVEHEE